LATRTLLLLYMMRSLRIGYIKFGHPRAGVCYLYALAIALAASDATPQKGVQVNTPTATVSYHHHHYMYCSGALSSKHCHPSNTVVRVCAPVNGKLTEPYSWAMANLRCQRTGD
jgi:hypothetical protein